MTVELSSLCHGAVQKWAKLANISGGA